MRLSDLIELVDEPGPIQVVGPGASMASRYVETAEPGDESAKGVLCIVGRTATKDSASLEDLAALLPDSDSSEYCIIVFRESPADLPLMSLARQFAARLYAATHVVSLQYELFEWACVLQSASDRFVPWPGSAGFSLDDRGETPDPELLRFLNQWQLESFALRGIRSAPVEADPDSANVDAKLRRETNRLARELQAAVAAAREEAGEAVHQRDELAQALEAIQSSRAYRIGRLAGDALHDWRKALALPRDASQALRRESRPVASRPGVTPRQPHGNLLHRLPHFNEGFRSLPASRRPGIAHVGLHGRVAQLVEAVDVAIVTPDTPFAAVAEHAPDLLVIDASALANRGPWAGVGYGLEVASAAILLEVVDQAQRLAIPVVFRWDIPFEGVPHAMTVAAAADRVVETVRGLAPTEQPIVAQGVPVEGLAPVGQPTRALVCVGKVPIPVEGFNTPAIPPWRLETVREMKSWLSARAVLLGSDVADPQMVAHAASYLGAAVVVNDLNSPLPGIGSFRSQDEETIADHVAALIHLAATERWRRTMWVAMEGSVRNEVAALGSLVGTPNLKRVNDYGILAHLPDAESVARFVDLVVGLTDRPGAIVATGAHGSAALALLEAAGLDRRGMTTNSADLSTPFVLLPDLEEPSLVDFPDVARHLITATVSTGAKIARWIGDQSSGVAKATATLLVRDWRPEWSSAADAAQTLRTGGIQPIWVGKEGPV